MTYDDWEELDDLDEDFEDVATTRAPETPEAQLARLLSQETMPRLRDIAKRRGLKLVAKNKAELLERLVPALCEPGGIDAAVATLDAGARFILDIADILEQAEPPTSSLLTTALKRLGRPAQSSHIDSLTDLALLLPEQPRYGPVRYHVPTVVTERLPVRDDLLRPMSKLPQAPSRQRGLGMIELFQVIVHELEQGAIGRQRPSVAAAGIYPVPYGWQPAIRPDSRSGRGGIQLEPVPPPLTATDIRRMAELTGSPKLKVELALDLLAVYSVVEPPASDQSAWNIYPERLRTFLRMSSGQNAWTMLQGWINGLFSSYELSSLVGKNGMLDLHYTPSGYAPEGPRVPSLRRLVARVVAHVPHDGTAWYSLDSLLDLLRAIAPDLLTGREWWLATRKNRRLALSDEGDWRLVWGHLVATMLAGPMSWLGLVEVAHESGRLSAFRATPLADALLGRGTDYVPPLDRYPITVDGLEIILTPGTPLLFAHSLVDDVGELISVSPAGLRYALSRRRLRSTFDDRVDGPAVIDALEEFSGKPLPPRTKQTIEEWWKSYGSVRVYDDVTLVELGDSLLPELLAIPPFKEAIIYSFSPRLVALDPQRADGVMRELTRRGYTPREVTYA